MRNSNHPDNLNTTVGVRPGCFSPPAPFTVRAAGRDSNGSARRVQTRSGDRRPRRTIRTTPAHCPTAPDLGCLVGFCCPHTHHTSPAPEATCSSRARRMAALRSTSLQRAEGAPERSSSHNRTQRRSTPAGWSSMPMERGEAMGNREGAAALRPHRGHPSPNPIPFPCSLSPEAAPAQRRPPSPWRTSRGKAGPRRAPPRAA